MTRIALLVETLYEDMELAYPWYRLREEGFDVDVLGTEAQKTYTGKYGYPAVSDRAVRDAHPDEYAAVVIPGGYAPDHMRRHPETIAFVRAMDAQKKTIAAICHGPWMLASACDLAGKRVTGFFSIKDDLVNAGAEYSDQEVVIDGHLITSRTPDDLIAFTRAIIAQVSEV